MFGWALFIAIFSNLLSIAFVLRWTLYLGIDDIVFIIFTDAVFGTFFYSFFFMNCLVMMAKIIPNDIEASMYALMASCKNLGAVFGSY